MEAIEQRTRPIGSATADRLRIAILAAVLVVGLLAGFGLGRVGTDTTVPPIWAGSMGQGPGHVPRVWVERS
jgi:hypothetical protein